MSLPPSVHPSVHPSVKFQFIELLTQLKMKKWQNCISKIVDKNFSYNTSNGLYLSCPLFSLYTANWSNDHKSVEESFLLPRLPLDKCVAKWNYFHQCLFSQNSCRSLVNFKILEFVEIQDVRCYLCTEIISSALFNMHFISKQSKWGKQVSNISKTFYYDCCPLGRGRHRVKRWIDWLIDWFAHYFL